MSVELIGWGQLGLDGDWDVSEALIGLGVGTGGIEFVSVELIGWGKLGLDGDRVCLIC
ncbi:hypothetical protein [Paenibacillus plantarum]|uniref:hypothetical protein n=1 Tax=Paenibacillus plantarum TaxID=2654975 RepID=UPI001490E13E|nr:hypothetical protein [Paenibacillus plantarum]